jgi:hypothetical protein
VKRVNKDEVAKTMEVCEPVLKGRLQYDLPLPIPGKSTLNRGTCGFLERGENCADLDGGSHSHFRFVAPVPVTPSTWNLIFMQSHLGSFLFIFFDKKIVANPVPEIQYPLWLQRKTIPSTGIMLANHIFLRFS